MLNNDCVITFLDLNTPGLINSISLVCVFFVAIHSPQSRHAF